MKTVNLDEIVKNSMPFLNSRTSQIFNRSRTYCTELLQKAAHLTETYFTEKSLEIQSACFIAVGSMGRMEALEASDLDLIPVLCDEERLKQFTPYDKDFRTFLSSKLGLKVSKGEDLTQCISINELADPETIGGDKDNSSFLTKRVLILTEGSQAGGSFPLANIRQAILHAYAGAERTRGRHVLSLCNDLARYYRTLCIEYKAKVDTKDKDWATRNMKLRHSRKFWYFSLITAIVALSGSHPEGETEYTEAMLETFQLPPYARIFNAIGERHGILLGDLFERYASFLEFMSNPAHRESLTTVKHGDRYQSILTNPFPLMKLNSDMLASDMISIIESLDGHMRKRIFEWFLL